MNSIDEGAAHRAEDVLEERLSALETMDLSELRRVWDARWGRAPQVKAPSILRRLIGWRLQSDAQGGLDRWTLRCLEARSILPMGPLPIGTTITREYQGELYRVEVVDGGFVYAGRQYRNLSRIALDISGTKWNGPKFFGLRT